jgi:hypothetical protein
VGSVPLDRHRLQVHSQKMSYVGRWVAIGHYLGYLMGYRRFAIYFPEDI